MSPNKIVKGNFPFLMASKNPLIIMAQYLIVISFYRANKGTTITVHVARWWFGNGDFECEQPFRQGAQVERQLMIQLCRAPYTAALLFLALTVWP